MVATILCLEEEEEENKAKRKHWVNPMMQEREAKGEFTTLYKGLLDDETKFYQYFRMNQYAFNILLNKIGPSIKKSKTFCRKPVSPIERLAVCLRFLVTGDSYQTLSLSYRLGSSTVRSIVTETCNAIVKVLLKEVMPDPTLEEWTSIAEEFKETCSFPNCIGAVDGKYIAIQTPPNCGQLFLNYKKFCSVVLLGLFDANFNFIAVDICAGGSIINGCVWGSSVIGKSFETELISLPVKTETKFELPPVLIGGEAFPLKPFLMRPYPRQHLNEEQKIYNKRLNRARKVSEVGFGMLFQKFRIYSRRIHALPKNVDKIVLATCVLHNFIRRFEGVDQGDDGKKPELVKNLPRIDASATTEALAVRDLFKEYFCSEEGSLPLQSTS